MQITGHKNTSFLACPGQVGRAYRTLSSANNKQPDVAGIGLLFFLTELEGG